MAFYMGLFFERKMSPQTIAIKKIDTILTTRSNPLKHFLPTLLVALIYITLQSKFSKENFCKVLAITLAVCVTL